MQDIHVRKDEEQYMQEGSEAFTRKVIMMVKYLSLKKNIITTEKLRSVSSYLPQYSREAKYIQGTPLRR